MKKTLGILLSGLFVCYMVSAQNYVDENVRRMRLPLKTIDRQNPVKHQKKESSGEANPANRLKEGFEKGFPDGWSQIDRDNDGHKWTVANTFAPNSGTRCIYSLSWYGNALTPNNYLITPQLTVGDNDSLCWYVAADDPTYCKEKYYIQISETGKEFADFNKILFSETMTDSLWHYRSIPLDQFAGKDVYIAFVHTGSSDQVMIKLDDIDAPAIKKSAYHLSLSEIKNPVPYTQIPFSQSTPFLFQAKINNTGLNTLTKTFIQLTVNDIPFISGHQASLSPGNQTPLLSTSAWTPAATEKQYDLRLTGHADQITDPGATLSYTLKSNPNTYARDNGVFVTAIGNNSPVTVGNAFTVYNPDTLTHVEIGFGNYQKELLFNISLFKADASGNDYTLKDKLFTVNAVRKTEMQQQFGSFAVPKIILEPGHYVLAIEQTGNQPLMLTLDNQSENSFWLLENQTASYLPAGEWGTLCARMIFNPVRETDLAITAVSVPARSSSMGREETVAVQVRNEGWKPQTGFTLKYKLNEEAWVSETLDITLEAMDTYYHEFARKADLSAYGLHTIRFSVEKDGDQYPENNQMETTTEHLEFGDIPYSMSFEDTDDFSEWKILDMNGDETTWNRWNMGAYDGTYAYRYSYNEKNPGDDWLISSAIDFPAAGYYKIAFAYKAQNARFGEHLKLYTGTAADPSKLTNLVTDIDNILNTNYQISDNLVYIDQPGKHYLGFYACSRKNGYHLYVDKVTINNALPDISLEELIPPANGCEATEGEISIRITNNGGTILNNIPVSYSVNGVVKASEVFSGPLDLNQSHLYTFNKKAQFISYGNYSLTAAVSMQGDTNPDNNTTGPVRFRKSRTVRPPYQTGFETSDDNDDWLLNDTNKDGNNWQIQGSRNYSGSFSLCYKYHETNAADDWAFSRCLELEAGATYNLRYRYRASSARYPEKMQVMLGDMPLAEAMSVALTEKETFNNEQYQLVDIHFSVETSGNYHIGFHALSDPRMEYINIDEVSINKAAPYDIAVTEIQIPAPDCGLEMCPVKLKVLNLGLNTITSFDAYYKVDAATTIRETVSCSIPSGEEFLYTYDTPADLSDYQSHTITAWAELASDGMPDNNEELSVSARAAQEAVIPYFCGFENLSEYQNWSRIDLNDDGSSWVYPVKGGFNESNCASYTAVLKPTSEEMLVSGCIRMLPGKYLLSFRAAKKAGNLPLNVHFASTRDADAFKANTLYSATGLNENFSLVSIPITIETEGSYYVAFGLESTEQNISLRVDDIAIIPYINLDAALISVHAEAGAGIVEKPVKIKLTNKGQQAFNNFTIGYRIEGQDEVIENINKQIAPNDTVTVTFSQEGVFDPTFVQSVTARILLRGDERPENNEATSYHVPASPLRLEFDNLEDFGITGFTSAQGHEWLTLDIDQTDNYGITGVEFPNQVAPAAVIVFNPLQTEPALIERPAYQPHSQGGSKYGVFFNQKEGQNDDWLISPKVKLPNQKAYFTFLIKSLTELYGREEYEIMIATDAPLIPRPSDFKRVTGSSKHEATASWTQHVSDLSAYAGQEVHVALRCISNQHFAMMVDNVDLPGATILATSASDRISDISKIGIAPNPVREHLRITCGVKMSEITILSASGNIVFEKESCSNEETLNLSGLPQGIYFVRIRTAGNLQTRKFLKE